MDPPWLDKPIDTEWRNSIRLDSLFETSQDMWKDKYTTQVDALIEFGDVEGHKTPSLTGSTSSGQYSYKINHLYIYRSACGQNSLAVQHAQREQERDSMHIQSLSRSLCACWFLNWSLDLHFVITPGQWLANTVLMLTKPTILACTLCSRSPSHPYLQGP